MFSRFFARKDVRPPSAPPGRRIYAIGDIHGRLDLFEEMLALIERDQNRRAPIAPEIVLLGDLIDRGPDSAGVVRRAMAPPPWARLSSLMGNHEATMLEALDGNADAMRMWLRFGGDETLTSWGVSPIVLETGTTEEITAAAAAAIPQHERAWIARLRQYVLIGDYFLVHAGVRPGVGFQEQSQHDSFWIRGEFLDSQRDHGAVVVHGHSISEDVQDRHNRIGIDTGAYATGRLTALALEGGERWLLQTHARTEPEDTVA